jgi:neutral ceramidase
MIGTRVMTEIFEQVVESLKKAHRQAQDKPLTINTPSCRRVFMPRLLLGLWIGLAVTYVARADEPIFRAGAYAIDVTPLHYPVPLVGSMTPKYATSAHDPLHARCLVLDDGDSQIAFAIVDSCLIPREIWDAAKARASKSTGIPISQILGAATHTHTAVCVSAAFQSLPDKDYIDHLEERIAQGIVEAHSRLEPARIGWAVGNNPLQVFNRRWYMDKDYKLEDPLGQGTDQVRMNPPAGESSLVKSAGPTDPEVSILAVQSISGKPLALLANYSLHYVGGLPPETLSADYFGEFAKQIGQLIGADEDSGFVGIMSNGTSGDINNINFFEPRNRKPPFEQIKLVAGAVAQSAKLAYDRIEFVDWVPLKMKEREIDLGVRKPTSAELKTARSRLAEAGDAPFTDRVLIYANESVNLARYPDSVKIKLQALRIGDLGIVATPTETFVETGLAIKKASRLRPTFTIELANGYNGYLPTVEQHSLGGYETWRARSSYLAVDAEPKVRRTLLELLKEVGE